MARISITDHSVAIWISARETAQWAANWPCSQVRNKRLFAGFDANGLFDVQLNGRDTDIDAHEFNAITSDFLRTRLPQDHPAWFAAVGQFVAD